MPEILSGISTFQAAFYQYGWERCTPAHQFGPAARTHYLFHYVISGTGLLMAQDQKGETRNYSIKSGQGFLLYPGQISTYIADKTNPWEYAWLEFDGLRVKEALDIAGFSKDQPIYHAVSKEYREIMMNEMVYIAKHPDEPPFHLIGHSYLFLDALIRSTSSTRMIKTGKMSDYYIKEAINFVEQNFPYDISIEDIACLLRHQPQLSGKDISQLHWQNATGIPDTLSDVQSNRTAENDEIINCRYRKCSRLSKPTAFLKSF